MPNHITLHEYRCWIDRLRTETEETIAAVSSFEARTLKAAKHPGCEVVDVVATRKDR